ncbi:MAG: type IX secretion system membrane protein PorP/SprF, partial [Bacteroidia bacterium]
RLFRLQSAKWYCVYLFMFSTPIKAQWIIPYFQNNFNAAGLNPAASGLESKRKLDFAFGMRFPNYNLTYNTKQNYLQGSFTYRPRKRFKVWHNFGAYVETEASNAFLTYRLFGSYTAHILLKKNKILSLGFFTGLTRIQPMGLLGTSDPVLANYQNPLNLFPDGVLGMRYTSTYAHYGISFRNMVFDRFQNFSNAQLGNKAENPAVVFTDFSYRIPLRRYLQCITSASAYLYATQPPILDLQALAFAYQRYGFGLGYRTPGTLYTILQARLYQKFSFGICYAYSLGAMRRVAPTSFEILFGLSPHGLLFNPFEQNRIVDCPVLYY